jgi:hypothetical protein
MCSNEQMRNLLNQGKVPILNRRYKVANASKYNRTGKLGLSVQMKRETGRKHKVFTQH